MKTIVANYNQHGYEVIDETGLVHYTASNHRQDSQQHAEPGTPDALPVHTIRDYAATTASEIAAELKMRFGGTKLVPVEYTFDRQ